MRDPTRFLRILGARIGFKTKEIKYNMIPRRKKIRKRKFFESIDYSISAITTNSVMPLKFIGHFGLFASFLNVLYIGYVFFIAIFKEKVMEGWITTSLQQATMFLMLFMVIATICHYLVRTLELRSDNPLYYIIEEKNSSVMMPNLIKRNNVLEEEK